VLPEVRAAETFAVAQRLCERIRATPLTQPRVPGSPSSLRYVPQKWPPPISLLPVKISSLGILLVHDDPVVIEALRATFQADGHSVTSAPSGQAGLEAFASAYLQDDRASADPRGTALPSNEGSCGE
jgi:hypothetical protein